MPKPEIPLMKAELRLTYRCNRCGEEVYMAYPILNYMIERRLKKPAECPTCGGRSFDLVLGESCITEMAEIKRVETVRDES